MGEGSGSSALREARERTDCGFACDIQEVKAVVICKGTRDYRWNRVNA